MKTKKNKIQTRKILRLRIIEHYRTQSRFCYDVKIDEAIVSKMINCTRDPTEKQCKEFSKLLKTPAEALFRKESV